VSLKHNSEVEVVFLRKQPSGVFVKPAAVDNSRKRAHLDATRLLLIIENITNLMNARWMLIMRETFFF